MSANTSIEWAHHTLNGHWGCTRVSPGCDQCYAATLDARWHPTERHWGPWAPRKLASESVWRAPFRWDAAARDAGTRVRVFAFSMGDWAEGWKRPELRDGMARLFATIALTTNIDWLLLTKRPADALAWLHDPCSDRAVMEWADRLRAGPKSSAAQREGWNPLPASTRQHIERIGVSRLLAGAAWWPQVWHGVTVEDQRRADERIPLLLKFPARVRWLSCEPLLEGVDLSPYMIVPMGPWGMTPPATWGEVQWPEWVPAKVRDDVADFWGPPSSRDPDDFQDSQRSSYACTPAFGARVVGRHVGAKGGLVEGRYVHRWNNIGHVVDDRGGLHIVTIPGKSTGFGTQQIGSRGVDWVVVGGESGHGARPCNVDWLQDIVNLCRRSAVPVFTKQLGANVQIELKPDREAPWEWDPDPRPQLNRVHDDNPYLWRAKLRRQTGDDPAEWPLSLRVREFPPEHRSRQEVVNG